MGLFIPEKVPDSGFLVPEGGHQESWGITFCKGTRTRGSGFELQRVRFRLHIRKSVTIVLVEHWSRLPLEVAEA